MSGIFGFTYRHADQQKMKEAAGGLEYWNRIYGREAFDSALDGNSGYGCCIEHFSNQYPYGGPLLTYCGNPAVVDALLYNRDELLPLAQLTNHSAVSDEELLLSLIECKGFDVLKLVNGDFAGAIFDRDSGTWTLFRDHMGVRPLFYYADPNTFVFATDLRGIVAAPDVDSKFNEEKLYRRILRATSLTLTRTDFQYIHCVMPGSVTRFTMSETEVQRTETVYWAPRQRKIRMKSDDAYRAELRRLVTDAVHRRCDVIPGLLGAELSGGLDSSVIDILINRHGRKGVYFSWSIAPERLPLQEGEDERKVVQDICDQENISCRFLYREDRFDFKYMLSQYMPPHVNSPHLAFGSKWMKEQGANVVFSGHGGDEGVSHRCRPFELFYYGEYLSYFRIYYKYLEGKPFRLLRAIRSGLIDARDRIRQIRTKPTAEDFRCPLFTETFTERMRMEYVHRPLTFSYAPHEYVRQGGSRDRLDNAAFLGAYCGVRYLFPYIDYRVMDYALSIPRRLHVNHRTSRLLFRETFYDLMPQSLRDVFYKDLASIRSADQVSASNRSFHLNLEWLLETLDPDIWGDTIDFEALKELLDAEILDRNDMGIYMRIIDGFNDCVAIQNIQKNAKRWREFDAENKIL